MGSVIQPRMASQQRGIGHESMFRPRRLEQPELLDLNAGSLEDMRANLREMWQINYWLGGLNALTTHLFPLFSTSDRITLLDLGTGGAEIPLFLTKWATNQQISLETLAVDWSARNLIAASENIEGRATIQLLRADALELPFAENSIDYVISSLFMHHFTSDQLIDILRKAYYVSRYGIVMSDLVRGYLPLVAFKLITPIFARNWLTRHDGSLSIYRAYTPQELLSLAQAAELPHTQIYTHWPWRMTLVIKKQP